MRNLSKAFMLLLLLGWVTPSLAVDKEKTGAPKPVATKKMGPSNLSTSDCRLGSGTVVEVTDGRCGASGQYCKQHDGSVRCIDKKD